jgi:uncharacterized protein (TIGR00297 family)
MTDERQLRTPVLRWQSNCVLAAVLVPVAAGVLFDCAFFAPVLPVLLFQSLGFGALLALFVWIFHAATRDAALAGGLFTSALYLASPGWRTALWPLLTLLLLTLMATRFGRASKEKLGLAEPRHGRSAAQVTANLGVAALAAIGLRFSLTFMAPSFFSAVAMRLALAAALAEAVADTLSSELGEVLGGEPRLITTLRPVPTGTDGAISATGTFAGLFGAAIIAAVASFALSLTPLQAALVALAAIAGLFVDSLLGAVFERRGWLNNDAVNFLSTLAAAILAAAFVYR